MRLLHAVKAGLRLLRTDPSRVRKEALMRLPGTVSAGSRAHCRRVKIRGKGYIRKVFSRTKDGLACFQRECLGYDVFCDRPWVPQNVRRGSRWILMPEFPPGRRLDRIAGSLGREEQLHVARQAGSLLFDIFLEGYAHRDFHAQNLFWIDGQLYLTDFETMAAYPDGQRPAFPECYDIIGHGLESPYATRNMGYAVRHPTGLSLEQILHVPVEELLREITDRLKEELIDACRTFKAKRKRHVCRAGRIYSSFSARYMQVTAEEAQRDSARRFENYGIDADALRGKSILDLGSNTGGMLLEAQRFGPSRCLGIEHDAAKVGIAQRIAAYNGYNNLAFRASDIDKLHPADVGRRFDVVFCLAIERHLRRPRRLYRLLGELQPGLVLFEGNSTTDLDAVEAELRSNGFPRLRRVGVSDDDCIPANNCRPLLIARRP